MAMEFGSTTIGEVVDSLKRVTDDMLEGRRVVGIHYVFDANGTERRDHAEVLAEVVGTQELDFSDPDVLAGVIKFAMRRGEYYGVEDRDATAFAWE